MAAEAARKYPLGRFGRENRIESVTKYFLFVVADEKSLTDQDIKLFLEQLLFAAQGCLGLSSQPNFVIRANPSEMVSLRARLEPFLDRVKESDFVLVILPVDEKHSPYFSIVKKMFFDLRICRQCVIFRTVKDRHPRILQAICTQINRKLVQSRDRKLAGEGPKRHMDLLTFDSKPQPSPDTTAADQELKLTPDSESILAQLKTEVTRTVSPDVTKIATAETKTSSCAPKLLPRQLRCKFCDRNFHHWSSLSSHVHRVHLNTPQPCCYYCACCGKRYVFMCRLISHLENGHAPLLLDSGDPTPPGRRQEFACETCGKVFYEKKASRQHAQRHVTLNSVVFTCAVCASVLSDKFLLAKHCFTQHYGGVTMRKRDQSYGCSHCLKTFMSKRILVSHVVKHRTGAARRVSRCQFCRLIFSQKQELELHLTAAHVSELTFACSGCDARFESTFKLRKHRRIHVTVQRHYGCRRCCLKFPSDRARRRHVATTHTTKHICPHCPREFWSQAQRLVHVRRAHGGLPRDAKDTATCGICMKSMHKWSVTTHQRTVHDGVRRNVPCLYCDRVFFHYGARRRHMCAEHAEARRLPHLVPQKSHACDYCPKRFFEWASKLEHERRIHTSIRPFSCNECEKAFASRHDLRQHKHNAHTVKYYCETCNEPFLQKRLLDDHVTKVHWGQKVHPGARGHFFGESERVYYYCPVCPAVLRSVASRDTHVKNMHGTGQSFSCEFCDKRFPYAYRCKQHIIREHPDQVAGSSTDGKPVPGVPAEGLLATVKLEDELIQDDSTTLVTPSTEAPSFAVKTEPFNNAVVVVPQLTASPLLITTTRVQVPRIVLGSGFQKVVLTLPTQGSQ